MLPAPRSPSASACPKIVRSPPPTNEYCCSRQAVTTIRPAPVASSAALVLSGRLRPVNGSSPESVGVSAPEWQALKISSTRCAGSARSRASSSCWLMAVPAATFPPGVSSAS